MDNKNFLRIKPTPFFKLKDKKDRSYKVIKLKELYGFLPETVIIEKEKGNNNSIRFIVVLTEEEIKKEDKILAEKEKKIKSEKFSRPPVTSFASKPNT